MTTVPLSGTNIRLLSGIPFTSDYKHTRWFDDLSSQTSYFLGKTAIESITKSSFQRIEGKKGHYIRVEKGIDALWNTNYIMFQNADYNNKWFYGFITKLEYKNDGLTFVHFDIDVLQTWMFTMKFQPSYVLREHCEQWNSDGTPVINTLDEGLYYGPEYEVVDVQNWKPYDNIYFMVIVSKSVLHGTPSGSNAGKIIANLNGMPQPLSYYIHPFYMDGTSPQVSIDGTTNSLTPITDVLSSIFKQTTAVNDVVSIYVTDYIGYNATVTNNVMTLDSTTFELGTIADDTNPNILTLYLKSLPNYQSLDNDFGNKYDGYKTVTESKLMMYPYTVLILDDFKGNRVVLKNEYIKNKNLKLTARGSVGTSNKTVYSVADYLNDSNLLDFDKLQLSLEHSLINNNPSDVPILSDYLSAYLQGNKNQIENQKSTIQFDGFMNGVSSGISGLASASTGNVAGVASSASSFVKSAGDSVLSIQGINAKLKDLSNVPPQLVKMGSNSNFDYGNDYQGVYIIKKQITDEYIKKLTDFFNMFGYKKNEVKIPNFHTRQYWNYVQTESCVINGDMNNSDLQALRDIFDNGITLWHTDSIGNYSLDNGVI